MVDDTIHREGRGMIEAWHFLPANQRLRYGSMERVEVGKTITVDCKPSLCRSGLHASVHAIDALSYAPGPIVCRVIVGGEIVSGDDKIVGTTRTVVAMADATDALWEYARWCALEVAHLWDMPPVMRQYLETGDTALREAARAAARYAAWDAARAAAWAAARDAAWESANKRLLRMVRKCEWER